MPPEATAPAESDDEKSKYDASIDVFSFGVVTIFIVGETFPCDPLAPNYLDEDSGVLIARTELQRRSRYMQYVNTQLRACGQLRGDNPLIRLIQQCLHNSAHKRPNIREVLGLLEEARAGIRDEESERNKVELVQALQNQPRQLRNENLVQLIDDLVTENADLQQQLQRENQKFRQQLMRKEAELSRAQDTIMRQQQQIRQLETENNELVQDWELVQTQQRLKQQEQSSRMVQSCEVPVSDFQKTIQQRDFDLETQRGGLPSSHTNKPSTSSMSQSTQQSSPQAAGPVAAFQRKLTVQCHKMKAAPRGMLGGSATSDDQFAYFIPADSTSVYRHEWSTEKWEQLPASPYYNSRLIIIDGALTTVGGEVGSRRTNKLFTLQQGLWVEHYPPMNTERSSPALVNTSDGNYVFVIGGYVGFGRWTTTVELFHVRSRRWYELTSLPQSLTRPSATICGNQLHVMGLNTGGYSCSLHALPSNDQPTIVSWIQLPQQLVKNSTVATLCGQLVIVGGGSFWSPLNSIHQLVDEQWVKIGAMSISRRRCLVVTPSPDKMMIVGGLGGGDNVEECVVV